MLQRYSKGPSYVDGFSSKKEKKTLKNEQDEKNCKRGEKTALTIRNLPTIEFAQSLILQQGGPSYEAGTEWTETFFGNKVLFCFAR